MTSKLIRLAVRILVALVVVVLGCLAWYEWRKSQRPPRIGATQDLASGITYHRFAHDSPRPLMIHLARVDLDFAELVVTPPNPASELELLAQKTTAFAARHDLQLAINGSFFQPFHARGPLDFYPHEGDPVDVLGQAMSTGKLYSRQERNFPAFFVSNDESGRKTGIAPSFLPPNTTTALAGDAIPVRGGIARKFRDGGDLNPRTAVGIDAAQDRLLLLVVDGRQPGYSEGVTRTELAQIIQKFGASEAIALDGGGSSTMVFGAEPRPRLLNAPFHTRIPMRERPVANHLGVRMRPAK